MDVERRRKRAEIKMAEERFSHSDILPLSPYPATIVRQAGNPSFGRSSRNRQQ
jgi:hypothetical protein